MERSYVAAMSSEWEKMSILSSWVFIFAGYHLTPKQLSAQRFVMSRAVWLNFWKISTRCRLLMEMLLNIQLLHPFGSAMRDKVKLSKTHGHNHRGSMHALVDLWAWDAGKTANVCSCKFSSLFTQKRKWEPQDNCCLSIVLQWDFSLGLFKDKMYTN